MLFDLIFVRPTREQGDSVTNVQANEVILKDIHARLESREVELARPRRELSLATARNVQLLQALDDADAPGVPDSVEEAMYNRINDNLELRYSASVGYLRFQLSQCMAAKEQADRDIQEMKAASWVARRREGGHNSDQPLSEISPRAEPTPKFNYIRSTG